MHFKVALELTTVMPSEGEINRWYGEPVDMVIIPSEMFEHTSHNNQISLKECYRSICQEFWNRTQTSFAVRTNYDDPWIALYPKCLRSILSNENMIEKHE